MLKLGKRGGKAASREAEKRVFCRLSRVIDSNRFGQRGRCPSQSPVGATQSNHPNRERSDPREHRHYTTDATERVPPMGGKAASREAEKRVFCRLSRVIDSNRFGQRGRCPSQSPVGATQSNHPNRERSDPREHRHYTTDATERVPPMGGKAASREAEKRVFCRLSRVIDSNRFGQRGRCPSRGGRAASFSAGAKCPAYCSGHK